MHPSTYNIGTLSVAKALRCLCFIIVSLTFINLKTSAQSVSDTGGVKNLISTINTYNSKFGPEKLYLTFDKPYYAVGDTIWFKAYLLNAADKKASTYSNKIYVELLNDSSEVRQRLVIPISAGLGQGDFKLETNLGQGAYTVRAYTNWLQNFGEDHFFHQRFYIGKPADNSWLIREQHQTTVAGENNQVKIAMQIKTANGRPVVNEPVTIRLLDGRKGIVKTDVQTGADGTINTDLIFSAKTDGRNLSLLLNSKQPNTTLKLPFYTKLAGDIDLQFLPEGGNIVAGLYNKIAFKAIGEDGLGVDVEGSIVNSKNEEVASFKSLHNGMGNFALIPAAGERYTARLNLPGVTKTYNLPVAKPSGLVMRTDGVTNKDTLRLYITGTADLPDTSYTLIAQGSGVTYFGTGFNLSNGYFNLKIPTDKFPTGIVNLMVTDDKQHPVLARNLFINHNDNLGLSLAEDKPVYAVNDSISLSLLASNASKTPVRGNFTVSVTDDAQVKAEKRNQQIDSYFLLSSELKGNIENVSWYFDPKEQQAAKALDNLMLTQGWTGFDAGKALAKNIPAPQFWAESDNSVEGQLRNFFNRPAAGRKVTLMSNRNGLLVIDTVSDANGRFKFQDLPFSDTIAYTIKIHNANGNEAAVGINVNEFKPAPLPKPDSVRMMPWYANTDTTLLNYLQSNQKRIAQAAGPVDAKGLLRQVNIKGRQKARLQGVGGEDIYFADLDIDDKQTTKQGNISLLKFLFKNYPGFHVGQTKYGERLSMNSAVVVNVSIDSVWVSRYYSRLERPHEFMQKMLDNIPAAAAKNVVIYHKPAINGKDWMAFIIIKTRSGNGPVLKETPGMYVYRPLPLYMPRDFYRPRYAVKNNPMPDLRSTIHWEPNVVTDENGNAKVSFYAADKPGTYTVTIEGTDMQGHFGTLSKKITICPAPGSKIN